MKFSEVVKHARPDLIVSKRHDEWLRENSNPVYSQEALDFGREQLQLQSKPRDRRGTISASSLDSCKRKQQFTFLGMPEVNYSPKTSQIFQNGTFMHIRWQMAGLTEGWLAEGEVPVPADNAYGLSGTRDGVAHEGSVVELKSINSNGFSSVNTFGPKESHKFQVGTYMVCSGTDNSVIIYEDKNTQDYKEFVVPLTKDLRDQVVEGAERLWDLIKTEKLAEPLAACEERAGYMFTGCPFRNVCLGTKNWEHAKEIAS